VLSILLVTAHPDDESMFFGPALLCRRWGQQVKLLCLSTGNADGLGETRKKELVRAAGVFGIPPPLVETLDDSELQDGMDTVWSPEKIEEVVLAEILRSKIHTVITFDEVWRPWPAQQVPGCLSLPVAACCCLVD
jgi:N-acetylglucosaminylphosphatidylinositol deacetylase